MNLWSLICVLKIWQNSLFGKSCSYKSIFLQKMNQIWALLAVSRTSGFVVKYWTSATLRSSSEPGHQDWGYDNFKVPPTGSFLGRTPFRFCCSFLNLTLRSPPSTSSSIEVRGLVQTLGCLTGSGLDDVTGWPFLTGSPLVPLPSGCPLWATSDSASVGSSLSS